MEDYAAIRQMYLHEHKSQRQIAKALGISRNTVSKYCEGGAYPGLRASYQRTASVITPDVMAFIKSCLHDDAMEPNRKQHHTARRIYDRLVEECGFTGAESTVRHIVHKLRGNLNEVFVPLQFEPGEAMQIDWGEADAILNGTRTHLFTFCARLAYSCAPFAICFRRPNTEAFLKGLSKAFVFFGGVPRRVIFDNAKVAVKSGSGKLAIPQDTYANFAAHYCFKPDFCNVRRGNEKGLVENLVGTIRRSVLSPVPQVSSLEELNEVLKHNCRIYTKQHRIVNRQRFVADLLAEDKNKLSPLPKIPYDFRKVEICHISTFSTARFETNTYSVPVMYGGRDATVRASAEIVEIYIDGQVVATHKRCYGKHQPIYQLEHYLPLLERKPRSILQAQPVKQNLSKKLLTLLESTMFPPKRLIAILKYCAENGEEAFWQHKTEFLAKPSADVSPANPITVQAVDLSQYDCFLTEGDPLCNHRP